MPNQKSINKPDSHKIECIIMNFQHTHFSMSLQINGTPGHLHRGGNLA